MGSSMIDGARCTNPSMRQLVHSAFIRIGYHFTGSKAKCSDR